MSDLVVKGKDKQISVINNQAKEIAHRLKFMITNGKKLSDDEVFALAQYSAANDLNPFAGECYYMPGAGPVPGIAGWRRKAQEQCDYEAENSGEDGSNFWVEFYPASENDAKFDPSKGDIAYTCVLRDYITQKRWRRSIYEAMREFKQIMPEASLSEITREAKEMAGKEPLVAFSAAVHGSEDFGRVEKFDRHERCKKRAEKGAIRQRFPRIRLPEPKGASDAYDEEDFNFVVSEPEKPEIAIPKDQILSDLGFETDDKEEKLNEVKISRPYEPEFLKNKLATTIKNNEGQTCSQNDRNMLAANIERIFAGDPEAKEKRRAITLYLVGKESVKDLTPAEVIALKKWLAVEIDSGGEYHANERSAVEAVNITKIVGWS